MPPWLMPFGLHNTRASSNETATGFGHYKILENSPLLRAVRELKNASRTAVMSVAVSGCPGPRESIPVRMEHGAVLMEICTFVVSRYHPASIDAGDQS